LDALQVTCSVEKACLTAGIARSVAYEWREADPTFRADWDNVIAGIVDEAHAKMLQQAREDESPAGVTARNIVLRAYMAETFNPTLVIRREMLRLALERARAEANGPPLIEGEVIRSDRTLAELQPIVIFATPVNLRNGSPHLPTDFDPDGWSEENPDATVAPFVPVKQDGTGINRPLPAQLFVEYHADTDPQLVASMMADGVEVSPEASTDLWARVRGYNRGLGLLQWSLSGLPAPQPQVTPELPPEPEGDPGISDIPDDDATDDAVDETGTE
jgi:hypothetical protein